MNKKYVNNKGRKVGNIKIKRNINISLIIFTVCIIGLLFVLFSNKETLSHTETKYKTIFISSGDTLWSISKEIKSENKYYKDKSLRDIIVSLEEVNELKSAELSVGQKMLVPAE